MRTSENSTSRTFVNKAKKKGRSCYAPAVRSALLLYVNVPYQTPFLAREVAALAPTSGRSSLGCSLTMRHRQ